MQQTERIIDQSIVVGAEAWPRVCRCGRKARFLWLGNKYGEEPMFVCGHHKRAYVNVVRVSVK